MSVPPLPSALSLPEPISQVVLAGPARQRVVAAAAVEKPAPVAVDQDVVTRRRRRSSRTSSSGPVKPSPAAVTLVIVLSPDGSVNWRDLAEDPDRVLAAGAAQADVGVGAPHLRRVQVDALLAARERAQPEVVVGGIGAADDLEAVVAIAEVEIELDLARTQRLRSARRARRRRSRARSTTVVCPPGVVSSTLMEETVLVAGSSQLTFEPELTEPFLSSTEFEAPPVPRTNETVCAPPPETSTCMTPLRKVQLTAACALVGEGEQRSDSHDPRRDQSHEAASSVLTVHLGRSSPRGHRSQHRRAESGREAESVKTTTLRTRHRNGRKMAVDRAARFETTSLRAFPPWLARVRLIRGAYWLTLKAASFRT